MKDIHFSYAAMTLVLTTACGSNEVGNGAHVDASQGGSIAVAGASQTSGTTGGSNVSIGGSGTGLGSATGGSAISGTQASGGAGNAPVSGGATSTTGGSVAVGGVGGATAIASATGGVTSNVMATGGSVSAATGGSVSAATGGSVSAATGGSVGAATGGSVGVTTGGTGTTTGTQHATGGVVGVGGSSGTICTAGELASCSTGLLGVCASGQKKCNATGTGWNDCIQLQPKGLADCTSTQDKDCDGKADNTEINDYKIDADQDKYCTAGVIAQVCKGHQASNAILATACLGTDCDDTSYFRNVSCTPCVTGLAVTEDENAAPSGGFTKINVDLNTGAGGNQIWLWKRTVDDAPCLTDIELSYSSNPSSTPFDSSWTVDPINLNDGIADDKNIRIGWKADPNGTPIGDVSVVSGGKLSDPMYSSSWYIAQWADGSVAYDKTLSGNADANKNVDGTYIYIIYSK